MFNVKDIKTAKVVNAEKAAKNNASVLMELAEIDKESISDIRAWIALQADAPQALRDKEALAKIARTKLK